MNLTLKNNPEQTMTSREIADLVESRHDDVKRSIDRLVEKAVISKPPSADGAKAANGITEKVYVIGKRDSYVIVAQLSPSFTARLVDRWQELEAGVRPVKELTRMEILEIAIQTERENLQLRAEVAAAAPAVAFVERYVESDTGSMGFRQVCKLLRAKEPEFRAFLHDKQIMYVLGGSWAPYAAHTDAGRFEVKTGTKNEHAYTQAKFTAKGVKWIAGEWAKHQLEAV